MISQLKQILGSMERIDPTSEKVLKIREVLKKLDNEHLQKIVDADIKFLKVMAQTELRNRWNFRISITLMKNGISVLLVVKKSVRG